MLLLALRGTEYRGDGVVETRTYGYVLAPHLAQVTIQQITHKKKYQADGRVGILVGESSTTDASRRTTAALLNIKSWKGWSRADESVYERGSGAKTSKSRVKSSPPYA